MTAGLGLQGRCAFKYFAAVLLLASALLALAALPTPTAAYSSALADIDVYGRVVYVVDGDTVDVLVLKVYDAKYSSFLHKKVRVRFADINAPELSTYEGKVAKEFLRRLIYGRYVYLDIDDLYVYGKYGRVIAVIYLPINTTHLLNINYYLVLKGYAEVRNYPNEFNPRTWRLYVALSKGPEASAAKSSTTSARIQVTTVTHTVTLTLTETRTETVVRTYTTTHTALKYLTKTVTSVLTSTKVTTLTTTKTVTTTPPQTKATTAALGAALAITAALLLIHAVRRR